VEWDPQKTSYGRMLRHFLFQYGGGSRSKQYKSAIWWHDEEQRRKAIGIQRRIRAAWASFLVVVAIFCTLGAVHYEGLGAPRFLFFLAVPFFAVILPGQLDVQPACPWYDAEEYHQKYMAKSRR